MSLNHLKAIGCDGTHFFTVTLGGVLRTVENILNRPVQWLISLIHYWMVQVVDLVLISAPLAQLFIIVLILR